MDISGQFMSKIGKYAELIGIGVPLFQIGQDKAWDVNKILNFEKFDLSRGLSVISSTLSPTTQQAPAKLKQSFKFGLLAYVIAMIADQPWSKMVQTIGGYAAAASIGLAMVDPVEGNEGSSLEYSYSGVADNKYD